MFSPKEWLAIGNCRLYTFNPKVTDMLPVLGERVGELYKYANISVTPTQHLRTQTALLGGRDATIAAETTEDNVLLNVNERSMISRVNRSSTWEHFALDDVL